MNIKLLILISFLVIAELTGAIIFFNTKDKAKRGLLSCLGLGFALAIVMLDVLPDSTEDFSLGYLLCVVGILAMFGINKVAKKAGGYTSVIGMGFHNFCEGVVLKSLATSMSPLLAIGAILHKFPEGMATFALLEGVKDKTRFVISSVVALLIPIGAFVVIPESIDQPIMSIAAGVIMFTVSKAILEIISENKKATDISEGTMLPLAKVATVLVTGMVIGGVSCLFV